MCAVVCANFSMRTEWGKGDIEREREGGGGSQNPCGSLCKLEFGYGHRNAQLYGMFILSNP